MHFSNMHADTDSSTSPFILTLPFWVIFKLPQATTLSGPIYKKNFSLTIWFPSSMIGLTQRQAVQPIFIDSVIDSSRARRIIFPKASTFPPYGILELFDHYKLESYASNSLPTEREPWTTPLYKKSAANHLRSWRWINHKDSRTESIMPKPWRQWKNWHSSGNYVLEARNLNLFFLKTTV